MTAKNELTGNYTRISNSVIRDPKLSPYAKTIYMLIRSYSPSYPSYAHIKRETGIKSKTTIARGLHELEVRSLIRRINSPSHKSNLYEFPSVIPVDQPIPSHELEPVQDMDTNKTNQIIPINKASESSPAPPVEDSVRKEIFAEAQSSLGTEAKQRYRHKKRPTFIIEASKQDV